MDGWTSQIGPRDAGDGQMYRCGVSGGVDVVLRQDKPLQAGRADLTLPDSSNQTVIIRTHLDSRVSLCSFITAQQLKPLNMFSHDLVIIHTLNQQPSI